MKRALALMAHPDDAEIFAGGSLALLQEKGWETHIASMTPGDCGSNEYDASRISGMRRAEAARAASLIQATYHCLDRRDLRVFYDEPTLQAVVECIRSVDPDIVFTHPPNDYMPDHEMTSLVTRAACFGAPAPNFDTGRRPAAANTRRIPHLYYAAPAGGADIFGEPGKYSTFVDVSGVIGLKADMLACHESQRLWLEQQHGMGHYVEEMKRWARSLGEQAGVEYAEAFRQHVGHPYPQSDLLAEEIGRPSLG